MLKQKHSIFVAQPLQGGVAVVDADGVKASEAAIGHKLRTFDEFMVEVSGYALLRTSYCKFRGVP